MRIIGNAPVDGEVRAVASGTLPDGKPVIVNADGTVSVVSGSSVPAESGSEVVFDSSVVYVDNGSSTFDTTNNRFIVAYRDQGNSHYGTAVVGTISGTSISFGTAVVFNAVYTEHIVSTFDSTSNKIVIVYQNSGNSDYGTAIVGTVSGNSISFGSPVVFESANSKEMSIAFDSGSDKIIVAYKDEGNSAYGTAVLGTVSGTSISFGTPVVFETADSREINVSTNGSGTVLIAYRDVGNSSYGTAVAGTISGTSLTFGTPSVHTSDTANYSSVVYDSNVGKFVLAFRDGTNSNGCVALVVTVSGTSVSFGSKVILDSPTSNHISAVYNPVSKKVGVAYTSSSNSNSGRFRVGTVSGTSITFDSAVVFAAASTGEKDVTVSPSGDFIFSYQDVANSYAGTSVVNRQAYTSTNLTSENYIGMSGGVVNSETVTQALGSVVDITNTSPEYFALAFDEDAGKVVVAYKEGGGTSYGYVAVGTVSGMSITFGTPVAYTSSALASRSQGIVFDSSNNKVVISYVRSSDNNGQAIVGTVSGDSISFGSATTFNAGLTTWVSSVFDTSNNKVVISYSDGGNSDYGTAIVGTVSGTSISFGTEVVFESAEATYSGSVFDSVNNKVVISYRDDGNSGKGTAIVGTVSGTSISFGTAALFNNASTYWTDATFDSTNGKAVVVYMDEGNSQYGTAVVGTVSGTDISFGSEVVFNTSATTAPVAAFDSGVGKVTVAYRNSGNSNNTTIVPATVSGTSISFDTAVDVGVVNGGGESIAIVFDSTNGKIVTTFKDDTANDNSAVVFQNAGTITTQGQVASGGAATVDIVGTVSTNQTGLTAGQQYFVQTDGTIGETPADPSVLAGTAISATKLVVKT